MRSCNPNTHAPIVFIIMSVMVSVSERTTPALSPLSGPSVKIPPSICQPCELPIPRQSVAYSHIYHSAPTASAKHTVKSTAPKVLSEP